MELRSFAISRAAPTPSASLASSLRFRLPPSPACALASTSALALCFLSAAPTAAVTAGPPSAPRLVDLAVSRSDGQIDLCELAVASSGAGDSSIAVRESWLAHTHGGGSGSSGGQGAPPAEVWAVAAPPALASADEPSRVLWSGADDALLKMWDTR